MIYIYVYWSTTVIGIIIIIVLALLWSINLISSILHVFVVEWMVWLRCGP